MLPNPTDREKVTCDAAAIQTLNEKEESIIKMIFHLLQILQFYSNLVLNKMKFHSLHLFNNQLIKIPFNHFSQPGKVTPRMINAKMTTYGNNEVK